MRQDALVQKLAEEARAADELHLRSRQMLISAVRVGAAAGLSQRDISTAIGRSQPEVSRLLRFHGRTAHARALQSHRRHILRALKDAGASNVRVFGSVGRGEDHQDSDIDLLVDFSRPVSLFALARLEETISRLVDAPVDIVARADLRPDVARRVDVEAVPL